jgi:CubicO group peptidase (beta-lactamase class C family)
MAGCSSYRIEDRNMTSKEKAKTHLDQLIADGDYLGIQYVVLNEHGVVFEHSGGRRDVAAQSPVTAHTSFMSASMTKTITALAVLQLVDQGQVALDAPLSAYFEDHPYEDELTVRQLIAHTAGIPNPMPLDWFHTPDEHEAYDERGDLRRRLATSPKLKSSPGAEYRYSNLGYWLLGQVVEQASGMPYTVYVRRNIIEPLGIPETDLGFRMASPDRRASGYIKRWSFMRAMLGLMAPPFVMGSSEGAWTSFAPLYMNGPAYGGLYGNARGWAAFLADQLAEDSVVMTPGVKTLFYEIQRTSGGKEIPMTLGWHVGELDGQRYFYKAGGGPGYSCNIRIYPGTGMASVWLSNRMEASESPIQELSDAIDLYFVR